MENQNPRGSGRKTLVIVALALLLVGALAFGYWAYTKGQDYKNNSDEISALAVEQAKAAQKTELEAKFAEEAKKPYRSYKSPATHGTISFDYPKAWSAYVDDTSSSQPINGFFHPVQVPSVQGETAFALRVELVNSAYASVISQYDSQIKSGKLKAAAYIPPKMAGVANLQPGLRLDGALSSQDNGSMVVLKIRDKTLKISTLSADFNSDFNDIILASLSFTP